MVSLKQGDCLELLRGLPAGSVDLVLTDPPYGTMTEIDHSRASKDMGLRSCEWDHAIDPSEIFAECIRVLRPNGKCILFSQEPYTSELITKQVAGLPFSTRAVWVKNNAGHTLGCKKTMTGYFEDICIFYKPCPKYDFAGDNPLRSYFMEEKEKCGNVNFSKLLGNGMASHYFTNGAQFLLPTEKNYRKLQQTGHFPEEYQKLKEINAEWTRKHTEEMNRKYPAVFNLWEGGRQKKNVLIYKKDGTGYHPTQKPVALLEDLIRTFSNRGDTVLDFTMGSGSTGVACMRTGRDFIGFEILEEYFLIAQKRIEEARRNGEQTSLFYT